MRKNWILSACLSVLSFTLYAQGGMTLYNMNYIPQASYLNPGNTPLTNFYLSLPGISGVGVGVNNDFINLDSTHFIDLLLKARWKKSYGDSLLSSFATFAQLSNKLGLRAGVDLFGIGFRVQKHYISFSVREELQGDLYFLDEMFRFIDDYDKGLVYQNTKDKKGYVMSGSRANLTQYRPFTLQYSYDVLPYLTVGGKVSYISGIWTLDATMDTLFTQIDPEDENDWDIVGRITARTAGYSNADSKHIGRIFTNPQNSGWAVGIGGKLTTLEDRLDIGFSAVNIGKIYWNQKVGLTTFTDESFEDAGSVGEVFDTLLRVEERANVSFNQSLAPEFFLNANYYLNQNMSIGALMKVQPIFGNVNTSFGLLYNARVAKWFGVSTGYIYSFRTHNIPLGICLNPGPVQIYALSDNVLGFLIPGSVRQLHFNFGLNLTFGKTARHWPETASAEEEVDFLVDENAAPEATEPEPEPLQPQYEEPGLPPRDTIYQPDAGQEPLYADDQPDVTSYLATNPILVYRGPSPTTSVLDTIPVNMEVNVLQKRLPDWWYVEYGDRSGWVQPRGIRPSFELPPSVQEDSDLPPVPLVQFVPQNYIMLDNTPMRVAASDMSTAIHQLKKWDEVLVIEKTNSMWWKIRHNGDDGYVKSAMLSPRPNNYVRPEETQPAPPKVAAPKPPVSGNLGVYQITESTSLRAQPTHESASLMRLRTGTKVTVREKTNQYWWKVEVNGQVGYAKAANLTQ